MAIKQATQEDGFSSRFTSLSPLCSAQSFEMASSSLHFCSSPSRLNSSRPRINVIRRNMVSASSEPERQALFNRIAPIYDNLNDILSLGQHRTWKRMCVSWSRAKRGDRVLDLCCGSGDLSFLLSQKVGPDGQVKAVDFSKDQLAIASTRQDLYWKSCYNNIEWIEGNVVNMPFEDSYFDAITVGYGLRNVVDKPKAMQEMYRVLKPGSRVSILDFNKSMSPLVSSFLNWSIDNVVVPAASRYGLAEDYKYLKSSIAEYLTGKELEKLAKEVGFSSYKHYEIGGGLMGNLVATR